MAQLGASLAATVGSALVSTLFSDGPSAAPEVAPAPAAPEVEPPPVMPIPDDEAATKARRRSIAKSMARRGRQSTILTDPVTGGDAGDALGS